MGATESSKDKYSHLETVNDMRAAIKDALPGFGEGKELRIAGEYRDTNKVFGKNKMHYDVLRLLSSEKESEITIRLTEEKAASLVDGAIVELVGFVYYYVPTGKDGLSSIQAIFEVEEILSCDIDNQTVTGRDREILNILKAKSNQKNTIYEKLAGKLKSGDKPKIYLVHPPESRAVNDFKSGVSDAASKYVITYAPIKFTDSEALVALLTLIEDSGYDVVAIMRGGGCGLDSIDHPKVLKQVSNMTTPVIAALGHTDDPLYINKVAASSQSTPQGLGQYLWKLAIDNQAKPSSERSSYQKKNNKETYQKYGNGGKYGYREQPPYYNSYSGQYSGYNRNRRPCQHYDDTFDPLCKIIDKITLILKKILGR